MVLRQRGLRVREFRVENYGAPPYPEVVLMTTRRTLQRRRGDLASFLAAVGDGAHAVLSDPEPAAKQIAGEAGGSVALAAAQLRAVRGLVDPSLRLDRDVLERWADFDARIGILPRRPDVARAFAFDLARPGGSATG